MKRENSKDIKEKKRVEENRRIIELLNDKLNNIDGKMDIEDINTYNLYAIAGFLGDISKSLAVIADAMKGEEK